MQFDSEAARFLVELIEQLDHKTSEMTSEEFVAGRMRLIESAKSFRRTFSHKPGELYSHLRNCLMYEKQLLCQPQESTKTQAFEFNQIYQAIEKLSLNVRSNESDNRKLIEKCKSLSCDIHEVAKKNAQLDAWSAQNPENRENSEQMKRDLQAKLTFSLNELTGMRLSLVDMFKETIALIELTQQKVIDGHLNQWLMQQGLLGNGAEPASNNSLEIIQGWCEHLAEVLWETREQIKIVTKFRQQLNADESNLPDYLPELLKRVTKLLEHLITRSFIVEKQPSQVLKTNTRCVLCSVQILQSINFNNFTDSLQPFDC